VSHCVAAVKFYSARVQIHVPLIARIASDTPAQGHPSVNQVTMAPKAMALTAEILARREIARRSRQRRIGGPQT
jgi:hypothetical protein